MVAQPVSYALYVFAFKIILATILNVFMVLLLKETQLQLWFSGITTNQDMSNFVRISLQDDVRYVFVYYTQWDYPLLLYSAFQHWYWVVIISYVLSF